MADGYQPGTCNIGRREKMKRYALGFAGLGAVFMLMAFKVLLRMPDSITLIVFLPLVLSFEGFYQGYFSFCAAFARQGIYDVSDDGSERKEVSDADARKKDLQKSRMIHLYSVASALLATIVIFIIFSLL